jgi:F0F1-type ATP synthase delta subunit
MAEKIDPKTIALQLFSKQKEYLLQLPETERETAKLLIFLSIHTSLEVLKLLMTTGNISLANRIIDELETQMKSSLPKVGVKVKTSVDLSKEDREKIIDILQTKLNKEIVLDIEIDKSIIVGFVIEYDGKTIDLPLNDRLDQLKQHLLKNINS